MPFDETAVFLNDFGKVCTKVITGLTPSNINFIGIFNTPGTLVEFSGMSVVSEDYSLIYGTRDVSLLEGNVVAIDGEVYKVREKMPLDDAVFSQVRLRKTG